MCGRIVIARSSRDLQRIANAKKEMRNAQRYQEGYNISPGSFIPCIYYLRKEKEISLEAMKWGFNHPKHNSLIFNARSDTINIYSFYKDLRRCVIMIEGYYEWEKDDKGKSQPHYITLDDLNKEQGVIYLAGLWKEELDEDGFGIKAMTIITQDADEEIQFIHSRMPVILNENQVNKYLEGCLINDCLGNNNKLKYHQVADLVNSFKNNTKDNILEKNLVKYNKNRNLIITNYFVKEGDKLVMKRSKSINELKTPNQFQMINKLQFIRERNKMSDDSLVVLTDSTDISHIKHSFAKGKRKNNKSFHTSHKKAKKKEGGNICTFLINSK